MDQMILCAMAIVALRWWISVSFYPADWSSE
jgi:hypothetical protein